MKPRRTLGEPGDLKGFPDAAVPVRLERVCRAEHGTWYFSSDGSGRFDVQPEGTCYFATDEYAALREASRLGPVSIAWVRDRELRTVKPPAARLAHTTHADAGRFGLTNELVTAVPYALPQVWATAFRDLGMDGIQHLLRHDQRGLPSGVSLFGKPGVQRRSAGRARPLTREMLAAAGVAVSDPPHSTVLRIIP
jgi:hypothetical protein